MRCKWHKCSKRFTPIHHRQVYCCKECSTYRMQWKGARGSALVDMLVDKNYTALAKAREKLLDEIIKDTPK